MKLKKLLFNEKGTAVLSYIVIVMVTIAIAVSIVPAFDEAVHSRSGKIVNVFNSTDTIVVD
ncbi:MAG: hypothetical protein AB7V16_11200 [Vulcanibacillus sp.]